MSPFDFIGHDEAYKLRNFLKFKIFDTQYADVIHKMIFGTPVFSPGTQYRNVDKPLQNLRYHATSVEARSRRGKFRRSRGRYSYGYPRSRRFESRPVYKYKQHKGFKRYSSY